MTNVVIGAASGMGAATARKLAPRGSLIVADFNLAGAERIAAEIGGDVRAMPCDVSDQAQVDVLMAAVEDLDALVVTAGLSGTQATGRRILEVNLAGLERVVRAAEPLARQGTVAVLTASQSGYMVPDVPELMAAIDDPLSSEMFDRLGRLFDFDEPGLAYQLSKRGVHRMARRHARAWGARGARILALSPGINDTPMNRQDEAKHPIMAKIIDSCPLGRRGTPEDIANVMAFLTSADAGYMTGSDVLVDGGMVGVLPATAWNGKIRMPGPA